MCDFKLENLRKSKPFCMYGFDQFILDPSNPPCLLNALETTHLVLLSAIRNVGISTSPYSLSRPSWAFSLRSSLLWQFQLDLRC